jgi:phosphoglycerate-specific signal transduction histidine kinase
VFNIQPGTGLGFTASKEIALGLGTPFISEEIVELVRAEVIRLDSYLTRTLNLESEL